MGIICVTVLIFWAISFFNSLKKRRAGRVFGLFGWILNFFCFWDTRSVFWRHDFFFAGRFCCQRKVGIGRNRIFRAGSDIGRR